MYLRRVLVVGRSFAAGAPPLTHVCTAGACGKKTRRGPPAALARAGVWRHARGDDANCSSTARHAAFNDHITAGSLSSILFLIGSAVKEGNRLHHADAHISFNKDQQRFPLNPPGCASFVVTDCNSEPHTGACPSIRLCVRLIKKSRPDLFVFCCQFD
jgi:hypothetical protein